MNTPVIKESFTNISGQLFPHVKEVAFDKQSIAINLGEYITETKRENNHFFNNDKDGVYIYRSKLNQNIGYRIYKEFADYNFNGNNDDFLIEELQSRKVSGIKFPDGVVTLNGYIIGQSMPFYNNSKSIHEYFTKNTNPEVLINAYKEILTIIKKLVEKGIYYLDVHAKNFMINELTKEINIIDFEKYLVRFDEKEYLSIILEKYIAMLNLINTSIGLDLIVGQLDYIRTFDEGFEILDKMKIQLQ